ncbi:MAG: ABC transporter permease [Planctomycetes bacterium]|nr:ABC transporter permease [Planctomycetota bacterium]
MSGGALSLLTALSLLVRRQLGHDPFRTGVSVLAVAVGVTITIAINGVMSGFEGTFVGRTIAISPHVEVLDDPRVVRGELSGALARAHGGIVVMEGESPRPVPRRIPQPDEALSTLRAMPEVAAAAAVAWGTALVAHGGLEGYAEVNGIDPGAQQQVVDIESDLQGGRLGDLHASGGGVILGNGLARRLGARPGDFVSLRSAGGGAMTLRVVALLATGVTFVDLRRCYVLQSAAQRLFGMGREVNRLALRLYDHDRAQDVAARAESLLGRRAVAWQDANTHVLTLMNTNKTLTQVVSYGVLAVAAFGILNVLMMMALEKRDSIALLKSLGYCAWDVRLAFLGQGLCLGLLGVAVGCVAGYHVSGVLAMVPIPRLALLETDHLLVNSLPRHYVLAGGAGLAVAGLASLLPAWRAGRMDPVEILRGRNA